MSSFLGVLEAVRYRISGGERLSVPSLRAITDQFEQGDASAIGLQNQDKINAYLQRQTNTNIAGLDVPVFFFDENGQHYTNVYPCLTFDIIGTTPRYDEFVYQSASYQGDMYAVPVATSQEIADPTDPTDTVPVPRQIAKRFVEHPLDILIELRTVSKDPIISGLLEDYIYNAFRPRDFLRVPMLDGSFRSWDVIFQSSNDLDKRTAVLSGVPGTQREYTKAYTYKVEGYFDNTDTTFLVNLVRRVKLNVSP